eukprot:5639818-Pyramimonas_sp.AAC.1
MPDVVSRTSGSRTPPLARCSQPGEAATCCHCHCSMALSSSILTTQWAVPKGLRIDLAWHLHRSRSMTCQPTRLNVTTTADIGPWTCAHFAALSSHRQ